MCENGHQFYKSNGCRSCPACENKRKSTSNFLDLLSAPARRALEREGICTLQHLSEFTEKDILNMH